MPGQTYTTLRVMPAVITELFMWWQYERSGTMRGIARALDVTPATVYYWGREGMPYRHAKKVVELTDGAFSMERLFPDLNQK